MKTTTVAEYLAKIFYKCGIRHVFFIPVIAVKLLKEMEKIGIKRIIPHSEKAAAYMADGYARIRKKPSLCMAQSVGAFNLASGLQDAFLSSSPVIAITGRRPGHEQQRNAYQEVDHECIFKNITKYHNYLNSPEHTALVINQAIKESTSACPGPVHIDIGGFTGHGLSKSIITQEHKFYKQFVNIPPIRVLPENKIIISFLENLNKSKTPLFVVGGGAIHSNAGLQFKKTIEKFKIPFVTSLNAKGIIPENHKLCMGVVGQYSRKCSNIIVSKSDLIIYLGSKTGSLVTNEWNIPNLDTEIIQVDINQSELGRNYPLRLGIYSDIAAFLEKIIESKNEFKSKKSWLNFCFEEKNKWYKENHLFLNSNSTPIRPERLCKEITKALPKNGILVSDTGHAGIWTSTMFEIMNKNQNYLRCAGSLGWAFPASLGVKCAVPERPVICFTGDGGIWYHLSEFDTAIKYGINVVTIINNNHSYNQEKEVNETMYGSISKGSDELWKLPDTNFAKIAESFGGVGVTITDPNELNKCIKDSLAIKKPVLIDVKTDINAIAPSAHIPRYQHKNINIIHNTL